jgi:serine/threonine protein kinase
MVAKLDSSMFMKAREAARDLAAQHLVRARIGPYRVVVRLASGGMGDVFLAVAPSGAMCVVKRLRRDLARKAAYRQAFLQESRLAARMDHPNVGKTHEVGEHKGEPYLAMEYIEGLSLRTLSRVLEARGSRLSAALAVGIVTDILAGLEHIHGAQDGEGVPMGIVHGDISPHNVMISTLGVAKVIDFGIAEEATTRIRLVSNKIAGKPGYIAPESLRGARADGRADIYAAGIVLWELLSGRRIVMGDGAAEDSTTCECAETPRAIHPETDDELSVVLARAMEHDPRKRFETARDMRVALEWWLADRDLDNWRVSLTSLVAEVTRSHHEMLRSTAERRLAIAKASEAPTQVQSTAPQSMAPPPSPGRRSRSSVSGLRLRSVPRHRTQVARRLLALGSLVLALALVSSRTGASAANDSSGDGKVQSVRGETNAALDRVSRGDDVVRGPVRRAQVPGADSDPEGP